MVLCTWNHIFGTASGAGDKYEVCMELNCILWYRIVLHIIALYRMVLHGNIFYLTVLHGTALLASARGLNLASLVRNFDFAHIVCKIHTITHCALYCKSLLGHYEQTYDE